MEIQRNWTRHFFPPAWASLWISSQLTHDQTERLEELCNFEDVHLSVPAWAEKIFGNPMQPDAICHPINKISLSNQGKIWNDMERFFSIHRTLIFFGTGSACKIFATRGVQQQRFVLMHVPYDRFRRMQVENSHFVLEELTIMRVLGVLDEAHGLYRLFQDETAHIPGSLSPAS